MPSARASSDPATDDTASPTSGADRVPVLLPLAVPGAFDYRVAVPIAPGSFVRVPLSGRPRIGVVWDSPAADMPAPEGGAGNKPLRLKDVGATLDTPPLPAVVRRFVDWVATYTVSSPGAVLRMAMSVEAALDAPASGQAFAAVPGWTAPEAFRETAQRTRVLRLLGDGPPRSAADIRRETGAGRAVIDGLVTAGAVVAVMQARERRFPVPDPDRAGATLTAAQAAAAAALVAAVRADTFSVTVLDGVTGSGKTEVYFEAIAEALRRGRQVLVLLPEIALSAQWLDRFATRFGAAPAAWHSELAPALRRDTWRGVAAGRVRVVVGARSALFLPFGDLGLIVIDEEHDSSFKQEDGVFYNARDMGVVRGHLGAIPVVLASATPSLETLVNVERGRYRSLHLPERIGRALLPEVALIDLRRSPPPARRWLAPPLVSALKETVADGEQALLFLNRRGYAPLTLCRSCGHRLQCPNCSAWLVEHRRARRLVCHHCGHGAPLPPECPNCGAEASWAACGPGVERIAEEVAELLPDARVQVVASDTVSGPAALRRVVEDIAARRIDVLIGTQVIAKGHHFPLLTLAGVVDGDLGLTGGDLRAGERSFQLLTQVAGRAGRADRPGRVLIQTHVPDHPVMKALAAGDRDAFMAAEKAERVAAGMPPYGRLAAIIVSGPDERAVDATAGVLGRARPDAPGLTVLGPAPAALALLRGRHRRRFLVKAARGVNIQAAIRGWLAGIRPGRGVRIQIDVDPQSFL